MLLDILTYWIILPLLFILILFFDFILLMGQENTQKRIQVMAGAIAGFLMSIVLIILDTDFEGIFPPLVDTTLDNSLGAMLFMLFLGFLSLFVVDLLLKKRVVPFLVMGNIMGIAMTIYQLTSTKINKSITIVAPVSFLIGIIVYYMLFGERVQHYIANALFSSSQSEQ